MIKVAQIIGSMDGGGVEAVVMNYFRLIDKSKFHFDFIVHGNSTHVPKEEIESLGGRIIYIPHYKSIAKYKKTLFKIFKENEYDIVHSHINTLSVIPLGVAKRAGVKVRIAHSHSTSDKKEWKRNIIKNLLRPYSRKNATHYFACTELAGRWLFGDRAFDEGKVTVIHNAIDIDKFKFNQENRNELRSELNLRDKRVVGHVGRFMSQKNHSFLIDLFSALKKRDDGVALLMLGDGPLMDEIKNKVSGLGLKNSVVFVGNVPNPEVYYSAMDCFVFPSLYEGLGMVAVEAQVSGLPVVASTAVPEEVKISEYCDFVGLDAPIADWINAVERSFELNAVCSSDKNIASDNYDIKNEVKKLENLYVNLKV